MPSARPERSLDQALVKPRLGTEEKRHRHFFNRKRNRSAGTMHYDEGMAGRFQFSIRFLLVMTTFVALAVLGLSAKSSGLAIAVVFALSVIFASVSIMAYTLASGTLKAFWLGVAVPAGIEAIGAALLLALVFRGSTVDFMEDSYTTSSLRITASILWCFAPINGAVCALVYRAFCHPPASRDALKNQASE
jgi:hypothetical protein